MYVYKTCKSARQKGYIHEVGYKWLRVCIPCWKWRPVNEKKSVVTKPCGLWCYKKEISTRVSSIFILLHFYFYGRFFSKMEKPLSKRENVCLTPLMRDVR